MSDFQRGLLAVPAFLLYSAVALVIGGTGGLGGAVLVAMGAIAAGYLIGSPWALLIVLPFATYGLINIDDSGPLENTDSGWGGLILLALALPVAVLRRRRRTSRTRPASAERSAVVLLVVVAVLA